MKPIEQIEKWHWDGWHASSELSHLVGNGIVDIRDLKRVFRAHMISYGFMGLYSFRVRRVGGNWRYFTVEL